jgi:hypothetical protein
MLEEIKPRYARYIRLHADKGDSSVVSFSQQWAKRYLKNIQARSQATKNPADEESEMDPLSQRGIIAYNLRQCLRLTIARAWSQTEIVLAEPLQEQGMDAPVLNSWEIAAKAHQIYENVLQMYAEGQSPQQVAGTLGPQLGKLRQEYITLDPLAIGFVNLHFYYTARLLTQQAPESEQLLLGSYFKVIQEYLNMPLQRLYEAAGETELDSVALGAVQQLLLASRDIAQEVCDRAIELYPNYRSVSGSLEDPQVKNSSLRDVEMFLVYLWVCVLENSIAPVQQELFPLCVLLYPHLGVKWDLVRQMLNLLGQQLRDRLSEEECALFVPYLQAMWEMFSPAVFEPKSKCDSFAFESIESLGNWVVG